MVDAQGCLLALQVTPADEQTAPRWASWRGKCRR